MSQSSHTPDHPDTSERAAFVDRHVGARIRQRRTTLGLSQQQLARTIGVTYQQANKYERGLNRVSAGRLYEIAAALRVPIPWFFDGLDEEQAEPEATPKQRMCLELARNFAAIDNEKHQVALSELARALALSNGGLFTGDPSREAAGEAAETATPSGHDPST